MPLAVIDGEVAEGQAATIPVTDEGLLRGDGVFEVIRLYDGKPWALDEHLEH
jgi:branched-chain amino acid aminotransferase